MGEIQTHPTPRQGRQGSVEVPYTSLSENGDSRIGAHTEAFSDPGARGSREGQSPGTRSREERVVGRGEQVLENCLFSSSFIFLPPLPKL